MKGVWTVIQARLGSTRLPRKVLLPFGDGLLIDAVYERAAQLGPPVALAIPRDDAELARKCIGRGWVYTEGSECDVLSRYVEAARQLRADHVVRVTADCPFLDVEAGRWTIQEHLESGADFTQYVAEGRGVEVFTTEALEAADSYAGSQHGFLAGAP
jgi:spore coat polysaccharide biosynthesis protein SpsF (cytidylyltransferase family)